MDKITRPTPEQVRDYMNQRFASREPPPSQADIRRLLGWDLIAAQREEEERQRLRNSSVR